MPAFEVAGSCLHGRKIGLSIEPVAAMPPQNRWSATDPEAVTVFALNGIPAGAPAIGHIHHPVDSDVAGQACIHAPHNGPWFEGGLGTNANHVLFGMNPGIGSTTGIDCDRVTQDTFQRGFDGLFNRGSIALALPPYIVSSIIFEIDSDRSHGVPDFI